MLKCREVTHLLATGDVETLSQWGRLRLRLHLLMCRHCHEYARQLEAIGRAVRRLWAETPVEEQECEQLERDILSFLEER